jgi:hypothetical protein
MAYTTELQRCVEECDKAREAVKEATISHSKGGSLDAVNKANARLASANQSYYRTAAGLARDDR